MSDEIHHPETAASGAQAERAPGALREHVAAHVDRAIAAGKLGSCRSAVLRPDGPHHLAHYDRGVYEFGVDVLAEVALAVDGVEGSDRQREVLTEVGRQLSFMTTGLDGLMREAETGRLVRVVLQTERDAVVCCSVIPREHLIGMVFGATGPPSVRPWSAVPVVQGADMVVSRLAAELRGRIGLPTLDLGGWLARMPGEGDPVTDAPARRERPDPAVAVYAEGAGDAEIMNLCRAALVPGDLQYVAHYARSGPGFALDIFQHPEVLEKWGHISPDTRREFYGRLYPRFASLVGQLGQLARPALRGRLRRVVLDVEEGAVFYYRLDAGQYLVGVTVNQSRVSHADDAMAELTVRCAAARN